MSGDILIYSAVDIDALVRRTVKRVLDPFLAHTIKSNWAMLRRQMAQRGRPKLDGVTKLQRDLTVVWSYNESRRAGEKHASAVASAASEVRKRYPGMKVSETEVKRVLARYQPKGYQQVFTVTKLKNGFGVGFGPRPEHTRINARKRPAATNRN